MVMSFTPSSTTSTSTATFSPKIMEDPQEKGTALLRTGFCFGFFIPLHFVLLLCSHKLLPVWQFPKAAHEKVLKEVELGQIAVPFSDLPFQNLRVFPLGIVKKKEPGKCT